MADISKIKVDGIEYDIKDAAARESVHQLSEDMANMGGIDVSGASVGQIVQVAAVDEKGVPTEWVPVDMPSGGGEVEWKKETITLTESVSCIEISNLSAKKVIVYAYLRGNDADDSLTTGTGKLQLSVNGHLAFYPDLYLRTTTGYYYFFDIEKLIQKTRVYGTKTWGNTPSWSETNGLLVGGWQATNNDASETVNSISLSVVSTEYIIAAGGWMEVYYK